MSNSPSRQRCSHPCRPVPAGGPRAHRKTGCLRPRHDANLSRFVASARTPHPPLTRATGTSCRFKTFRTPTRACRTRVRAPDSCGGSSGISWAASSSRWPGGCCTSPPSPRCRSASESPCRPSSTAPAARLALAGGLLALACVGNAVGDTFLHRTAVTNWITAAARVQQLLARKAAQLGSALTRRVAAGEVVAVSTGDVEKIGWFVEAWSRFTAAVVTVVLVCVGLLVYQPALGVVVAVGLPVLALAVLPLLPRATRRADTQREKAGRATELASDTVAGLRVLRGIGGEELFLDRYRRASQEVRHAAVRSARMWSLISAIQVLLPGTAAHRGRLVRRAAGAPGPDHRRRTGHRLQLGHGPHLSAAALRGDRDGVLLLPALGQAGRAACCRWNGPRTPPGRARPRSPPAICTTRPPDCSRPPAGSPPWCAATRTRRGGWRNGWADTRRRRAPSVLLGGVPLDELPARDAPARPSSSRTRTRCCSPARCANCSTYPRRAPCAPGEALAAAQCDDVLAALVQGSLDAADPMDARITERGPVAVRRPAPAARARPVADHGPGGARPGRADLGRRLAHRGTDRGGRAGAARGAHDRGVHLLAAAAGPRRPGRVPARRRGRRGRRPPRTGAHRAPLPGGGDPRDRGRDRPHERPAGSFRRR